MCDSFVGRSDGLLDGWDLEGKGTRESVISQYYLESKIPGLGETFEFTSHPECTFSPAPQGGHQPLLPRDGELTSYRPTLPMADRQLPGQVSDEL